MAVEVKLELKLELELELALAKGLGESLRAGLGQGREESSSFCSVCAIWKMRYFCNLPAL